MDREGGAPDLSVVIPFYNESGNVTALADEVRAALEGTLDYELILVDDGSTDTTAEEINALAAADERVVALCHDRNRGQSAAVWSGAGVARAPVVGVLDGDGQNDPADLPRLYERLVSEPGLEMVIGERQKRQDSWVRLLSSRVANGVRSRVLGDGIRDTGCGIKVLRRETFLALPAFDHMHRFLPALLQRDGGQVAALAVNHRARQRGQSKYGVGNRLWVGITDMLGVMWLKKRRF
jgi:dolichol-phosphate mannosyltransferase